MLIEVLFILCILIVFVILFRFMRVNENIYPILVKLDKNLCNPMSRGAFGERIAEDIFKFMNLTEGIHYNKQLSSEGIRPDFTVNLFNGLCLNIDSKFPLTNYYGYIDASNEVEKKIYLDKFLKDVKNRIREVISKDYISPLTGTVDFAVVFIPNEQIFQFILEKDCSIIDFCLSKRIILTGPWGLYSVLSIILLASNFIKIDEELINKVANIQLFEKEWLNYKDDFNKFSKKLEEIQNLKESLEGLRLRKLEKELWKFRE